MTMFSLTINLDDPDKLAYVATIAHVIEGDGNDESLPHNIVEANDWYLNCLTDRAASLVDESDAMLGEMVMHLRSAADRLEKEIGRPREA